MSMYVRSTYMHSNAHALLCSQYKVAMNIIYVNYLNPLRVSSRKKFQGERNGVRKFWLINIHELIKIYSSRVLAID